MQRKPLVQQPTNKQDKKKAHQLKMKGFVVQSLLLPSFIYERMINEHVDKL